jgi:hypothetical protein
MLVFLININEQGRHKNDAFQSNEYHREYFIFQ